MVIQRPDFTLKPVTEQNLAALFTLYRQCEDFLALGPEPQASPEMVLADLAHAREQGGIFCGIYDPAGTLMGVIEVIPQGFAGNPAHAFISLLMIALPFRQRGLGSQVLEAIEAELRQNPRLEAILSAVQVNNPAALRFWQRQGYQIADSPTLQSDGTTTVALKKELFPLI